MGKGAKSGGTSRIRFVMFDAEIADGDIGPITQAMQNALRAPGAVTVQRLAAPMKTPETNGGTGSHEAEATVETEDAFVETADETPARQRAPRKPAPTPKVVNNLDMDTDISLGSFVVGKNAKSHLSRFLIAAAWLKEHRNIDAVTADHIYTCYRKLGWPTNINDFVKPLRDLKAGQFFTQAGKGTYVINHLGLDRVKNLGGAD